MSTFLRRPGSSDPKHQQPAVRRGQAMVEFALVVLFAFLPMIFGTIELGRSVWYHHQLSQLSREGARWLIVTTAASTKTDGSKVDSTFLVHGNKPQAAQYVLGTCNCPGTAVGHMASMQTGLDQNRVQVKITQNSGPTSGYVHGARVTVAVTYPYQPLLTRFLRIPVQINLKAETSMRLQ